MKRREHFDSDIEMTAEVQEAKFEVCLGAQGADEGDGSGDAGADDEGVHSSGTQLARVQVYHLAVGEGV